MKKDLDCGVYKYREKMNGTTEQKKIRKKVNNFGKFHFFCIME